MGDAKRRRDAGKDWSQTPAGKAERAEALRLQEIHEQRRIQWQKSDGPAKTRRAIANIPDPPHPFYFDKSEYDA